MHKPQCGSKLSRAVKHNICAVSQDRKAYREAHRLMLQERLGDKHKIWCKICGDTQDECKLVRTKMGILCVECVQIQLYM
jgi:hypothetical protein